MSAAATTDPRADRLAARATGAGVGTLTFMVSWLVGIRITAPLLGDAPGAWLALALAFVAGVTAALIAATRLGRTVGR